MKITREDGVLMVNFGENAFLYFENDWRQLFGDYNWQTYRLADIYYENDEMLGGHVFQFVLFGLGFHFRKNNPDNPDFKKLVEVADEIRGKEKE